MAFVEVATLLKRGEDDFVVREVSFVQQYLQKIAIAGETGSGKSTLLKMIAGLVQPDAGHILFENKKVIGPEEKLVAGHPDIAYLSQHFELPKSLRVEQVLTYANLLSDEEAETLYDVCHINHLLKRRTDQLSGGEKQRVALARLLTGSPKLLLLDEPFSNLDRIHKTILQSTIHAIGEQLGITIILVSHDPSDTLSWADEIIVMKDGRVVQQGLPLAIYKEPVDAYVAGLFGRYSVLNETQLQALAIHESRKPLFFRPEDFTLSNESNPSATGRVTRVLFLGSHYEIEATVWGGDIIVRTEQNNSAVGDAVQVSLSPAYIARYNPTRA